MSKQRSKNLLKAGYALVVLDRNTESIEKVVTEPCEVIITMLPNSPHVKEVVLGKNGVIKGAKVGSMVIDMSSIAPLASR